MNKAKSIFVTALVALLTATSVTCLYLLKIRVWLIAVGLLGLYGFACGAVGFCRWLGKEAPLLPAPQPVKALHGEPVTNDKDLWQPSEEWNGTYDQIREEMEGENV